MKNKKAILPLRVLIVAIILAFTAFIVLGWFADFWAKGAGELKKRLPVEYDDEDDIPYIFDKCPCEKGVEENQGCPEGKEIPKTQEQIKEARECLEPKEEAKNE